MELHDSSPVKSRSRLTNAGSYTFTGPKEVIALEARVLNNRVYVIQRDTAGALLVETLNEAAAQALHDVRMARSEGPDVIHDCLLIYQFDLQLLHRPGDQFLGFYERFYYF